MTAEDIKFKAEAVVDRLRQHYSGCDIRYDLDDSREVVTFTFNRLVYKVTMDITYHDINRRTIVYVTNRINWYITQYFADYFGS